MSRINQCTCRIRCNDVATVFMLLMPTHLIKMAKLTLVDVSRDISMLKSPPMRMSYFYSKVSRWSSFFVSASVSKNVGQSQRKCSGSYPRKASSTLQSEAKSAYILWNRTCSIQQSFQQRASTKQALMIRRSPHTFPGKGYCCAGCHSGSSLSLAFRI